MQAVAAELSGYAGEFRCFSERRIEKQFVLIHLFKLMPRVLNANVLSKGTMGMVSNWKSPNQIETSLNGDQIDTGITKSIFIIFEKLKQFVHMRFA
jgi:hypothetical protein